MAIAYARECSADILESLAAGVKRRHVHLAHELTTVSAQDPHLGSSVKKPDSERSEWFKNEPFVVTGETVYAKIREGSQDSFLA